MKQIIALLSIFTITLAVIICACNKKDKQFDPASIAREMASDVAFQQYYTVIKKQTAEILPNIGFVQQDVQILVKNSVTKEQIEFLYKQGIKLRDRYHLGKYTNFEIHDIFDKAMQLAEKMPGKKGLKIVKAGVSPAASDAALSFERAYPHANPIFTSWHCVDTYWVVWDINTGQIVSATYMYSECTPNRDEEAKEVLIGEDVGGGGGTPPPTGPGWTPPAFPDPEKKPEDFDNCWDDYLVKKERCERNAKIASAIAFVVAGIGIGASSGTLTGPILVAFEAAITKVAIDYGNCMTDARQDYDTCLKRQNPGAKKTIY